MTQIGAGYVIYGDEVETLSFDWGSIKILSEPDVTGAHRMSFGMVILNPGSGHERHNHPDADEVIYVVSGEGHQMLDDQPPVCVRPGACIYIPQGVFHSTINTGWEPLRLIIVYAPSGSERKLREVPGCRILAPGSVS